MVDRAPNNTWLNAEQYSQNNSISYAQDNEDGNIEEEEAFIHRLKSTANDTNSSRTIQDIYNRVLPYLTDILEEPPIPQDQRPVYQNQSSGYMKFRHLNQGIIIRNTNSEFIDGLDPNNPRYLSTGFTITMWVRFLDKKSEGTLFNFGNPTRNQPDMNWNRVPDGLGFKLETYVVNRNNYTGYPTDDRRYDTFGDFSDLFINDNRPYGYVSMDSGKAIYENTDSARFVRLVVNGLDSEGNPGWLRSSETGNSTFSKYTWNTPDLDFQPDATNNGGPYNQWDELRAVSGTHIPEDFDEWYFICATYNPNIIEPDRYNTLGNSNSGDNPLYDNYKYNYNFWMNHYLPNNSQDGGGSLVANSGYGNQCKVEIISRSDLLRARGFRV